MDRKEKPQRWEGAGSTLRMNTDGIIDMRLDVNGFGPVAIPGGQPPDDQDFAAVDIDNPGRDASVYSGLFVMSRQLAPARAAAREALGNHDRHDAYAPESSDRCPVCKDAREVIRQLDRDMGKLRAALATGDTVSAVEAAVYLFMTGQRSGRLQLWGAEPYARKGLSSARGSSKGGSTNARRKSGRKVHDERGCSKCGGIFVPGHGNQKYCKKCQPKPSRKSRRKSRK